MALVLVDVAVGVFVSSCGQRFNCMWVLKCGSSLSIMVWLIWGTVQPLLAYRVDVCWLLLLSLCQESSLVKKP